MISEALLCEAEGIVMAMQAVEAARAAATNVHYVLDSTSKDCTLAEEGAPHLALLLSAAPLPHRPFHQLPGLHLVSACIATLCLL